MKKLLYLGLLSVCVLLGSCVEKNVSNVFDKVEGYMDVCPDSALLLLEQIPHSEELRGKQRADYALLLTQARDKNYLDSLQSDSLIKIAVDYYKNGEDKVKAGKALFYYGKVMDLQGNDMLAMQAYLNALAKLEKTEEYKLQGLAYEYIGILNADRKLHKDALDNYQSSVYCFQKAADTLGVIYAYRDIARIYYVEQKYDSVYNYINRALSLCEKKKGCISFERVIPSLLQVKGIAKRNEGDLGDAIALLKTAVETEQDRHSMHHCSMSLGNIYLNQNKLDEAKRYFTLALKSERPRTLAGAYHYLYLLEKRQKKYAIALYFKEKSDSLLSVDLDAKQASQILTLQRKYEKGKLLLEKQQVEHEKKIQFYFGMVIVLFIILLCLVLYFLLRKKYKEMFRKNMQVIKENECMIKRYVYELDMLKQKAGETAETNREKVGKLNQKILLLESENKKIRENVCVNGVYLLEQLKKEKLIVKNMTKQEKEQLLEYMDLIYGNLISRLKKDFKLTSGNLILIALLKVGFTTTELMFTFDCEMNSIFTKKRRLRENLNLDTNDKLEEFITLY
ncbi:hypothetical protein [Parabacteroides goldsteinii]|uniref:hypothetical protein n=1 Tax=Parabacteroides goldsteinii TaxID=328812 RepID=UPI00259B5985|nr:hypothetical protein [Parabacteroides goldsteinii]